MVVNYQTFGDPFVVILALPAFVLAWLVIRLPEPARGGRDALTPDGAEAAPDETHDGTAAQQLARERRIEPEQELVLTSDPRRMGFFEATRYILRIRTNVVLILASALSMFGLLGACEVPDTVVTWTARQPP